MEQIPKNPSKSQNDKSSKRKIVMTRFLNTGLNSVKSSNRGLISSKEENQHGDFYPPNNSKIDLKKITMRSFINSAKLEEEEEMITLTVKVQATQEKLQIEIPKSSDMLIKNFKMEYLDQFTEEGKYKMRLIYNGRELRDSHNLSQYNFNTSPTIHVFLALVEETANRKLTTVQITDANGEQVPDFDHYVEIGYLTEEEVGWKRFCFHAPFIFQANLSLVSDPVLFSRELEYMAASPELKDDYKKFLSAKFDEKEGLKYLKDFWKLNLFICLLCTIFGFPTLIILLFEFNPSLKRNVVISNFFNIVILSLVNMVYGDIIFGFLQSLYK